MDVPEPDRKRVAMTFDMLKSLNDSMIEVCKQPDLCETKMDNKIKTERKRKNRINIGLGGGGGVGVFGILEIFRRFLNGG